MKSNRLRTNESKENLVYSLMNEGQHMNLMFLPAGAIAWLFDRPEPQVLAAGKLAEIANEIGNKVIDSALLRADKNVLVLHFSSGRTIMVYPEGGMGSDGNPLSMEEAQSLIDDVPGHELNAMDSQPTPSPMGALPTPTPEPAVSIEMNPIKDIELTASDLMNEPSVTSDFDFGF